MKVNSIIRPESSCFEKGGAILVALLWFVPFIYGLITDQTIFLVSLPIGIILILVYNAITKGKFVYKNWIQEELIEFNKNGVHHEGWNESFNWNEMENLKIEILGFDGQSRSGSSSGHHRTFNGTESNISFQFMGKDYQFYYYLRNKEEKKQFIAYLRDQLSPHIESATVKIFFNRLDRYVTYQIKEIEAGCEDSVS
ncbi:MAG: hypothetical protein DSY77_05040 [Bacteroidetes bacterium]|nr:MAG: hypothetical protein DSY77_05040 [Bacteroidota bacterium]